MGQLNFGAGHQFGSVGRCVMSNPKRIRRHSFSSLEEVSKELEGATVTRSHPLSAEVSPSTTTVHQPDNSNRDGTQRTSDSSRKRPLSPNSCSGSEDSSPRRAGGTADQQHPQQAATNVQQQQQDGASFVCLPHGIYIYIYTAIVVALLV